MAPDEVDFERDGLLDGLDGEARRARLELLEHLVEAGATREQLEDAVARDRLALLPVELVLGRDCVYTVEDLARESGLSVDFLIRNFVAIGLPRPEPDDRRYTEQNLQAARLIKLLFDGGVSEERVLKIDRVFAHAFAQMADAGIELAVEGLLKDAESERDLGLRMGQIAQQLTPALGPMLEAGMQSHLRERIASRMISSAELAGGRLPDAEPVAVCFADLVGFTSFSEHATERDVGEVADRFGEVVGDAAVAPVRLVKQIGDGAMLVAPEPGPLVDAAFATVDRAAGAELPPLRVGLAAGEALTRAGDWYGRPVNLASRICDRAPPGDVIATDQVCEAVAERFESAHVGDATLKGFDEPVPLYRLERR